MNTKGFIHLTEGNFYFGKPTDVPPGVHVVGGREKTQTGPPSCSIKKTWSQTSHCSVAAIRAHLTWSVRTVHRCWPQVSVNIN